jgi:ADP-dependent NAD(P)H-hydrate dehydratase / NAD(P)H-hydrate epimerase
MMTDLALYTNDIIRAFERDLFEKRLANAKELMQTAGKAAFNLLQQRWPNAQRIAVFCGSGNNGGDGFVLARLAKENGLNVSIYSINSIKDLAELPYEMASACEAQNILIKPADKQSIDLTQTDVIVDALLGSGLKGMVKPPFIDVIGCINQSNKPVLSIDIPSGLNANTGQAQGPTIKANGTLTFIGLKQGLFTGDAPDYCGQIICHSLNIPKHYYSRITPTAYLFNQDLVGRLLKKRPRTANKGCYGHVLVIGGDYGMAGAVRMTAEAALRVGAGLVSVATHKDHRDIVNAECPEIMCHAVESANELIPLLTKATVVVVGPGLGQSKWSISLLNGALNEKNKPFLLDADALNLIANKKVSLPSFVKEIVITPHPGEAARLLNVPITTIQHDRFAAALHLQQHYHATVVLKGAGTLIQSKDTLPVVCTGGNPGMATAGMGDVLSGVIGGLLAQRLNPFDAAQIGVYLHAKAADMAALAYGERGLSATDLFRFIQKLSNISE